MNVLVAYDPPKRSRVALGGDRGFVGEERIDDHSLFGGVERRERLTPSSRSRVLGEHVRAGVTIEFVGAPDGRTAAAGALVTP